MTHSIVLFLYRNARRWEGCLQVPAAGEGLRSHGHVLRARPTVRRRHQQPRRGLPTQKPDAKTFTHTQTCKSFGITRIYV